MHFRQIGVHDCTFLWLSTADGPAEAPGALQIEYNWVQICCLDTCYLFSNNIYPSDSRYIRGGSELQSKVYHLLSFGHAGCGELPCTACRYFSLPCSPPPQDAAINAHEQIGMVAHERSVGYLAMKHHAVKQHLVWKMLVWYRELPLSSQLQDFRCYSYIISHVALHVEVQRKI